MCRILPPPWGPPACRAPRLTHAGNDAVHRQAGRPVVGASPCKAFLLLLLLLLEDESRVLLLGDVDVEASVGRCHDVPRAGVQQDALVLLPPDANQTDAVPAWGARRGHSQLKNSPLGLCPSTKDLAAPSSPRDMHWQMCPVHPCPSAPVLTSCAHGRRRR